MSETIVLYPSHEKCPSCDRDHLHMAFDFPQIALLKLVLQKDENPTARGILKNIMRFMKMKKGWRSWSI
jgi:hypothetical protein